MLEMKSKSLLLSILMIFASFLVQAQDAASLLKEAGKALKSYNIDPAGNADKLIEAKDAIASAFEAGDLTKDYKAQVTKAQIYSELAGSDYKNILLKPDYQPKYTSFGVKGVDAVEMALGLAEKKWQIKEVMTTLAELATSLSTVGNQHIGTQDFAKAYGPLNAVIKANGMLVKNGEDSLFGAEEDKENHLFVTAVCALQADEQETAAMLLEELYQKGAKEPRVYSYYYNMLIDEDKEKAMKVMAKGKEISPDNIDLLFAEINYYIKEQQYDMLEEKLKQAIAKDPENPSVYSALGNVYMNLSEQNLNEGNEVEANKYFDEALSYFNQTLELKPESFDALYSMGSLYFNKAAHKTKQMQELGLSKEDQVKFDKLDQEVKGLFETALPFFVDAEKYNASDRNTIIALKEIFARKDDFEKSNEFKARLEKIDAGETITESYFKE
jgi:tetratricopeptide (TPR) repeat protein